MMNFFQSNMQTSILVLLIVLVAILCVLMFFFRKNISDLNGKLTLYGNEFYSFRESARPLLNLHYSKPLNPILEENLKTVSPGFINIGEQKSESKVTQGSETSEKNDEGVKAEIKEEDDDYIGETDDETEDEEEDEKMQTSGGDEIDEIEEQVNTLVSK